MNEDYINEMLEQARLELNISWQEWLEREQEEYLEGEWYDALYPEEGEQ